MIYLIFLATHFSWKHTFLYGRGYWLVAYAPVHGPTPIGTWPELIELREPLMTIKMMMMMMMIEDMRLGGSQGGESHG